MNTIDAFENDIYLQAAFLKNFKPQKPLSISQQKKSIFCGTGDSYAAGMLAEAFSNMRVRAVDPLDVLKNKDISKGNTVHLVSISGNTISNISVAKVSKNSVAITHNKKSKLARACSKTILLDYTDSGIFTAGSIGFLASALGCISLVTRFQIPNVSKLFKQAIKSSRVHPGSRVFVLGNLYTYPVAMYAAAKFYEVLGIDAHYERIEQFSHMGLFSAKKGDTVILYEGKNKHNEKLVRNLTRIGLQVIQPEMKSQDKISQVLFYSFVSQLIPLFEAKRNGLQDCYFVTSKKIRNASSNMIY